MCNLYVWGQRKHFYADQANSRYKFLEYVGKGAPIDIQSVANP